VLATTTIRMLFAALALALAVPAVAAETVVGQVACSSCWHEADRASVPYGGESDRACAVRCAKQGIPPAIAVRDADGGFRLLTVGGQAPGEGGSWLDWIGRYVRASVEPAGDGTVRVASIEALPGSPWTEAHASDRPGSLDDLAWTDLTGARQSLAAWRGRIVIVNFWATWCRPCLDEMPALGAIQNDYAALGVQTIGIAADGTDGAENVLAFARRVGIVFPVWLGATTADMAALGVGPALPATVVLDRDGTIAHRVSGVVDAGELRRVLDRLLRPAESTAERASRSDASLRAENTAPEHDAHRHRPGEASLVPS